MTIKDDLIERISNTKNWESWTDKRVYEWYPFFNVDEARDKLIVIIKEVFKEKMKKKTLRMILGIGMMFCFLNLVQFINFWVSLKFTDPSHYIVGLVAMQWMWIPNVALILIIYLLLTRWFPYDEKN